MGDNVMFAGLVLIEVAVVAGMLLIQPFVVRRGLLFGVYVGEERWDDDEARAIRQQWMLGMIGGAALGIALGSLASWLAAAPPVGFVLSLLTLVVVSYGVYLRAYFQAKPLAAPGAPAAAAALVGNPPHGLVLPVLSVAVALAAGAAAVGYAWLSYPGMPAQVPTHFGPSGRPDAWSPRSIQAVMLLPLASLVVPTAVGITACLVARAKRAIRVSDGGVSIAAQMRFRQASALFTSGMAALLAVMLAGLSAASVQVALGRSAGIPVWLLAFSGLVVAYALAGTLYLALHYGQGGARLERRAGTAPLANGVADNSRWYLGGFYVNRDDPSIFVEKRFGIGYTINFGNPRAVLLLVAFLAAIAVIVLTGILTPQTHTPPVR